MPSFAPSLLSWYQQNARALPWRDQPDPYRTWVAEIMLQQTRVEAVIPYFERWMRRFPNIQALANASQQDILSYWEGLGYYSRARNLHRASQIVVQQYEGKLPEDLQLLRKLPGIGRYTAAAIASIAFGQDEPTLDGNIRRVMARLFDVEIPARSAQGEKLLWNLAKQYLPAGQASQYNQALMDLGASICAPQKPQCKQCPVVGYCQAYAHGVQEERPVLAKRAAIPHYTVAAAIIHRSGNVLIAQRPQNGLLGGLWEFPGGKTQDGEDLPACLSREIREELGAAIQVEAAFGVYKHAYTHFRVTLHAFFCTLLGGEPRPIEASAIRWVRPPELSTFPMGKIDRQIASGLLKNYHSSAKKEIEPDADR